MAPIKMLFLFTVMFAACSSSNKSTEKTASGAVKFSYSEIEGIGYEKGVSRRDPSDIIKVDGAYYIWYTKIMAYQDGEKTPLYPSGYYGTIWYAVSKDGGHTWQEVGEALGRGVKGTFDSHAVFTPNILEEQGRYYLYYTGVQPTPGSAGVHFDNNSVNDLTAIGVAVAGVPDGPFRRLSDGPVLSVSNIDTAFDSYRVDDAALAVRDGHIWLYYKGRSKKYGDGGPANTKLGVAFAENPAGPFEKYSGPILNKSHEVLAWSVNGGMATLASLSHSLNWAADGLHFSSKDISLSQIPHAPGLYRPELTDRHAQQIPGWGVSMETRRGDVYLVRFEMKAD